MNLISKAILCGSLIGATLLTIPEPKEPRMAPVVISYPKPVNDGLRAFMRHMARIESDNNAHATNRFGMLGKYQFHPLTLRDIGIRASRTEFLNNERLQDTAMVRYMRANERELRPVINKFSGKTVRGIRITKAGIIASAHLTGTVGVLAFFYPEKYSHATSDANGTSVSMYMKEFAKYNF